MRKIRIILLVTLSLAFIFGSANYFTRRSQPALIHLYGEVHGLDAHFIHHFYRWKYYYTYHGMRHLFIEMPFYHSFLLNLWMEEEDDKILQFLFDDIRGQYADTATRWDFYQRIKAELPNTIFHGVDMGIPGGPLAKFMFHEHVLEDSDEFNIIQDNIMITQFFYDRFQQSLAFRSVVMSRNFATLFNRLNNESVMGIFGAAHVEFGEYYYFVGGGTTLASLLAEKFGYDNIHSTNLLYLPGVPDVIEIAGIEHSAMFFGGLDLSYWRVDSPSIRFAFWRLDNPQVFKGFTYTGGAWPTDRMPIRAEIGQVFAIEYTLRDGAANMVILRASGHYINYDVPVISELLIE